MSSTKSKDIVFIHGWGEDSRIWEGIANHLSGYNHHFIDLGFISEDNDSKHEIIVPKIDRAVFVTHSLGTIWALNHIPLQQFDVLVAINGFGRFTDFASNNTLKTMAKSLHCNIFSQMKMFWKNCNLPENMQQIYRPLLNREALSQGLTWLGSWDECKRLQDLKTMDITVLSLGSENDLILPLEIMKTHWRDLGFEIVIKEQAGHVLPVSHPKWCARQIKRAMRTEK